VIGKDYGRKEGRDRGDGQGRGNCYNVKERGREREMTIGLTKKRWERNTGERWKGIDGRTRVRKQL
jgi:hypothetical protein